MPARDGAAHVDFSGEHADRALVPRDACVKKFAETPFFPHPQTVKPEIV